MPLYRIKKVWDYCTYNKAFFILILILFVLINYLIDYVTWDDDFFSIIYCIYCVFIYGYGMSITRDRINEGHRLPKISFKDIIILGILSFIVFSVYLFVQGTVLDYVCSPLDFPNFDLEDMLLELPETLHMLYTHNPVSTIIFMTLGAIIFYIFTFFMEISLARLADTGSIIEAFNLIEVKRNIDLLGWGHYAKDYTKICIAIVSFTALQYITLPIPILDYIWIMLLSLFAFTAQFLGIGAVYSEIKKKEYSLKESD